MKLRHALVIAQTIRNILEPHCERIAIAGSIRRKKPDDIKDVEIVAIPKPYETGLFESGIATVVNKWHKVKGDLPCKYTQRVLPLSASPQYMDTAVKLDLFFATPENWGLILAIRTGSADYSHQVLASGWVKKGYYSKEGMLYNDRKNPVQVREEADLFRLIGIPYVEPERRSI